MRAVLIFSLALVLHAGIVECEDLEITYHSDPEGAMLYANTAQTLVGYTPVTLKYKVDKTFRRKGECRTLEPVMVRWASGVEASTPTVTACGKVGLQQQLVFVRPELPGREIDASFAIQIQQLAAINAQARAQAEQALWNDVISSLA